MIKLLLSKTGEKSHVKIISCPVTWKNTMLSLQDSVFFEISIKSLLKSWSSSCEYPVKHELMFTFFTWPPDLSPSPSKETLLYHYMYACREIMLGGFLFPPCKRKWLLMELSGWLMMVHQACFMCMQVAAALPSSSAYRCTGFWLSIDMPYWWIQRTHVY